MSDLIQFKKLIGLDKRQLGQVGAQHAQELLDAGFHEPVVMMVQARKAQEYLAAMVKQLDYETRENLEQYDNSQADIYGANLSLGSTGDRLDYDKDAEYARLKKALQDRKDLLTLAKMSKDVIYDADGIEVMKLPVKIPSKEVLKVKL